MPDDNIPMQFWAAIDDGDLSRAVEIATAFDHPFISRFTHEVWHATLEYFGVAQHFMRPSFRTLDGHEMEEVKKFFEELRVDTHDYMSAYVEPADDSSKWSTFTSVVPIHRLV